ncbi:amino acid/polyamine transporter I [Phaeosphaeria sp. MPI-PUGE-AT-0046c]|nr:amino acid/polyamine transporter I [Phaeosphaeria sp. MPI-PUGE-AT-0046c]
MEMSDYGRSGSAFTKSNDEEILAHFGKRQQLRRNLSFISVLGLGCTLMLTWEASLAVSNALPPLKNGGTAGALGAFLVVAGGVLTQVLVMAEMASMMPLSGGEYNWVSILAPPRFSNLLSYLTGWVTTIAWQAATASTIWIAASVIQLLAILNFPTYVPQVWHGVLIFYAVVAIAVLFTTVLSRFFPSLEALVLILHILGFFAFLLVFVYLAPVKATASEVFGTFLNGGGFSSNAQSVLVGAVTIMWSFNAVDGATHMAEEIENAATVIPYSMILTTLINGSAGFAILVAFVFCMGPLEEVLNDAFSFPLITMLLRITNSTAVTSGLVSIITVLGISSAIGQLATASRMLWAFAREDGVPFSRWVAKVEPRIALPLNAIAVTALISLLLALLNLGSSVAFYALTGLTVSGFYSAFMISASIMLWRRLTIPHSQIAWGPFRLGYLGTPITVVALVYSFIGWFFSFWPPVAGASLNVQTFNWSMVVYFSVVTIALVYWFLRARHTYTGPKMEGKI